MEQEKIYIDEENTQIIWGLIAVVCIGMASYILFNAFMAGSWQIAGYTQLISLTLFTLGFYSIIRITTPLFHFVVYTNESTLVIEIWREEDEPLDIRSINLNEIQTLRIAPHSPRAANEALFDFSTSYKLIYKTDKSEEFRPLINLENESFTLKVEDIGTIMDFLISENPDIYVPESDAVFMKIQDAKPVNHKAAG